MALDNTSITKKLYNAILLRDPTAVESSYWANELTLNLTTPSGMVLLGASTSEFTDVSFKIALMYTAAFGTYGSNTELMAWRQFYDTGASLTDIGKLFVNSKTFAANNPSVKTTTDYINTLAKQALGRNASASELTEWVTAVDKGTANLGNVLLHFASQSPNALKIGLAMLYSGLTGSIATDALLPASADAKVAISSIVSANLTPSTLSYDKTQLVESSKNDGAFEDAFIINLAGGAKFAGSIGAKLGDVTKVPAGLTASLTKVSDTQAKLSFSGKATAHDAKASITDLTVTFKDTDFSNTKAADVENNSVKSLSMLFRDNLSFSEQNGTLDLTGTVLGDVVLSLVANKYSFSINGVAQTLTSGTLANVDTVDASNMTGGKVTYTGTSNADIYFASNQGDSIRAMAGDDVIQLGNGTDTVIFETTQNTNGNDVIDNFTIGAAGDVLNLKALLNNTGTSNIASVASTSTAARAWNNGDVLVVSGNGLTTEASIAALFGVGQAFAAPTTPGKSVVISADVIGNASVWHIVNDTDISNITANEVFQVATLIGVNNLALVGFNAANFA